MNMLFNQMKERMTMIKNKIINFIKSIYVFIGMIIIYSVAGYEIQCKIGGHVYAIASCFSTVTFWTLIFTGQFLNALIFGMIATITLTTYALFKRPEAKITASLNKHPLFK